MDFPNQADLERIGRDEALARAKGLTRSAIERDGSDANILNATAAAIGDEVVGALTTLAAGLFLDSAEKAALDRLVFDRYGLVRKPAGAALGSVNFSLPANNPAPFTIPAGQALASVSGAVYLTSQAVTFPSGTKGPITVEIRSKLAGADQQAAVGAIANISGAVTGAPAGLAVTNVLATAGATDEESDPDFRTRAKGFFTNARRGTLSAIVQGALDVTGVQTAETFEVLDSEGRPARYVQLVITDAFTDQLADLNQDPPAYQAQSQVLAQTVFDGLSDVRAGGIYVQVQVAQVVLQAVYLALTFSTGTNIDAAVNAARSVTVNYVNGLPPGTSFSPYDLETALKTIQGLIVTYGQTVVSPPGNVVPTQLQAIRTTPTLVSLVSAVPGVVLRGAVNPDIAGG